MGGAHSHDLARTVDLRGKTVVVTGSNSGLGKATAQELARTGARVILACRNQTRAVIACHDIIAETGNKNVVVKILDLASLQSVRDFADDFNATEDRLDILVNNAGIAIKERALTEDGFELMFGVNHLGHFLLTNLLLDKLKSCAPSRVVTVASIIHMLYPIDLDDLQSENNFGGTTFSTYGRSKSANILFTVQLAKVLEGTGVSTYCVHPGFVSSDFHRNVLPAIYTYPCLWCCMGLGWLMFSCNLIRTPLEAAYNPLYCCLEPSIAEVSGRYYSDNKVKAATANATDPVTAQKLWDLSANLVRLQHEKTWYTSTIPNKIEKMSDLRRHITVINV